MKSVASKHERNIYTHHYHRDRARHCWWVRRGRQLFTLGRSRTPDHRCHRLALAKHRGASKLITLSQLINATERS